MLDEAEADWESSKHDFEQFLKLSSDPGLSVKARRELTRLPALIKEDATATGKADRQYTQHLQYAAMLQRAGFSKEVLLEAGEVTELSPIAGRPMLQQAALS